MRHFLLAFLILLIGCFLIPGGSDDFRMDALLGKAILEGESPYLPGTAYGGTTDFVALRTPVAHMLALPFGIFTGTQLVPLAAVFVALTGAMLIQVLRVPWWTAVLIVVWPFSEVDRHGKWTFLLAALLILTMRLKPVWAGLTLALAVGINLWPAVAAVGLLVTRRRMVAVWSAVWFAGLSLVMLATSVSVEGTVAALSQDVTFNPANMSNLRWWPWWTIPVGVVLFGWWARGKDPDRVVAWSVPVGLTLSPVLWAAYLPALVVFAVNYEEDV